MNPKSKALVQESFKTVLTIREAAADIFYDRLFELDPSLIPMFMGDRKEQGKKLISALTVCVSGLTRIDQIIPLLQALGRRHSAYGVRDSHYDTVGSALLWTLAIGLGDAFTPECRQAWEEAYTLFAKVMREAVGRSSDTHYIPSPGLEDETLDAQRRGA